MVQHSRKQTENNLKDYSAAEAGYKYNKNVLSRCKPGDLLRFPRKCYFHFVVYAGDGNVIHVTVERRGCVPINVQVKEESFWKVVGNRKADICNYKDDTHTAFSGPEIVERARSRLGNFEYKLLKNNCEHFATWCRYGEGTSKQVDGFMLGRRAARRLRRRS
ncbi:PREDICTED: phospholipid-metabolizing enzyme A-C1-like [Branchiostoma belcheri]|uniref:Phospholipid-metabolizing enzyme A-C1-like n=1 Tax=Branchiostoma belcheri TaxID=7741 RepID=A0A6P5AFY9_BRABE|nr:PREDICTED: phospholipid-metabolizing enzyme A-C1-like [Branchiostoma belcheri]